MDNARRETLRIGRIGFDLVDFDQAVARVMDLAGSGRGAYVVTPNTDHVVRAEKDPDFVRICHAADLVLADGMPLVWASRWLPQRLPMRIAGSDLAPRICAEAARLGLGVFLLGGMPGEAEKATDVLHASYPDLKVVGTLCPPFGFEQDQEECQRIVSAINRVRPALVLVGVGSPKQERWIDAWRDKLDCGVLLGVGATIGFMAGTLRRAPVLMQKTGTEWLFRMSQEPQRLVGRYARDLAILAIVFRTWREARVVGSP